MMVWQARERNEWDVAIRGALDGRGRGESPCLPRQSDPFSLADPETVMSILDSAGVRAAVDFRRMSKQPDSTTDPTSPRPWTGSAASPAPKWRWNRSMPLLRGPVERVREAMAAKASAAGVWFRFTRLDRHRPRELRPRRQQFQEVVVRVTEVRRWPRAPFEAGRGAGPSTTPTPFVSSRVRISETGPL